MKSLPLKKEAHDIIVEFLETETYKQHLYMYLSLCASNAGFFDARKWFYDKSCDQSYSVRNLLSLLEKRGIKQAIPSVEKIEGEYPTLKSCFEYAFQCEMESIQEMEAGVRRLFPIDLLMFQEGMNFMCNNKWSLDRLQELITIFSAAESKEQELELESKQFGCHDSSPTVSA